MHDPFTIVTERGQTSIPAALRQALKLRRGARLEWERLSDTEMLVRVVQPRKKPDPMAMIGFGSELPEAESTERYMRRIREAE